MIITATQLNIIKLLAKGLSCKEIAEKLETTERNIESSKETLIRNFGAKGSTNLISICYQYGILKVKQHQIYNR